MTVEGGPLATAAMTQAAQSAGERPSIELWYLDFDQPVPLSQLAAVTSRGASPIITWEPWLWGAGVEQSAYAREAFRCSRLGGGLTKDGAGATTIENALGLLRALRDMAVVDQRIPSSPVAGIKPPRRKHQSRGYLNHGQVDALATTARTQVIRRRGGSTVTADRPDHEAIILLLAYTGLRWGEMAALRVGSVNLERCRLDVYEAIAEVSGRQVTDLVKNHERRSVPFPDFLFSALSTLMAGRSLNSHIFVGETGGPIRVSTVRPRAFAPVVKRRQAVIRCSRRLPPMTSGTQRHPSRSRPAPTRKASRQCSGTPLRR